MSLAHEEASVGAIELIQTSPAHLPIIQWQVSNGFSDVDEANLVHCHEAVGLDYAALLAGKDFLTGIILALMLHFQPGMSQLEANVALAKGESKRSGGVLGIQELPVEEELVYELVHPSEARIIKEWHGKQSLRRATRADLVKTRQEMVRSKVKLAVPKGKPKPAKALNIKHWAAAATADHLAALAHIDTYGPPKEYIKIFADEVQGRFRLSDSATGWHKSVSWTRRGWKACTSETLFHCWEQYNVITGHGVPNNLADLPALFDA